MLKLNTDHDPEYGVAQKVSPLITRVTANNPSKFTFKGTGTYIVGTDSVAVIDPGPYKEDHIEALCKALEDKQVSHILITHTHPDHSPGAALLKEKVGGLVCGFAPHPKDGISEEHSDEGDDSEEVGDLDFIPEKFLVNGEIIVGNCWTLEAVYTPGHISNHLCFAFKEENAIFTGDHVMGWSTSIIPPPNGNLKDYMGSLELLKQRSEDTYFPTHGAPISNAKEFVEALIAHRQNRNAQILDFLGQKKGQQVDIKKIVADIYKDYPEELHKPAGRSVWAHLIDLHRQKMVHCEGSPQADSQYWV